jgi:hypothetical protein
MKRGRRQQAIDDGENLYREIVQRVEAVPGVRQARRLAIAILVVADRHVLGPGGGDDRHPRGDGVRSKDADARNRDSHGGGAGRSSIAAMIAKQSLPMAMIGITVGPGAAAGLSRLMRGMLYQIDLADPAPMRA